MVRTAHSKIAVFGVPTSAGAHAPGVERGPFALRERGLLQALAADGTRVVNLSDLSLFPYRDDPGHPRARNTEVVACAVRASADEMTRALAEGFTLLLGGDSTLAAGAVQGAHAFLKLPVSIVYIAGHADLETPETTRSGLLERMSLSLALGNGPDVVARAFHAREAEAPRQAVLLGVRDWEAAEQQASRGLALVTPEPEIHNQGPAACASAALSALSGPVVVHFGVDVIRSEEMPATSGPRMGGGISLLEAAELLRALVASPRVVALVVTGYDPSADGDGRYGQKLVDLIVSAMVRHPAA
jgi:arginase